MARSTRLTVSLMSNRSNNICASSLVNATLDDWSVANKRSFVSWFSSPEILVARSSSSFARRSNSSDLSLISSVLIDEPPSCLDPTTLRNDCVRSVCDCCWLVPLSWSFLFKTFKARDVLRSMFDATPKPCSRRSFVNFCALSDHSFALSSRSYRFLSFVLPNILQALAISLKSDPSSSSSVLEVLPLMFASGCVRRAALA
mmetsp:Transcript_62709/g.152665  ORF Transcript_62709/g.152665 Transcript_62709/m.152665 type:complete len:201 (-) Transcript_62709:321-923(-)